MSGTRHSYVNASNKNAYQLYPQYEEDIAFSRNTYPVKDFRTPQLHRRRSFNYFSGTARRRFLPPISGQRHIHKGYASQINLPSYIQRNPYAEVRIVPTRVCVRSNDTFYSQNHRFDKNQAKPVMAENKVDGKAVYAAQAPQRSKNSGENLPYQRWPSHYRNSIGCRAHRFQSGVHPQKPCACADEKYFSEPSVNSFATYSPNRIRKNQSSLNKEFRKLSIDESSTYNAINWVPVPEYVAQHSNDDYADFDKINPYTHNSSNPSFKESDQLRYASPIHSNFIRVKSERIPRRTRNNYLQNGTSVTQPQAEEAGSTKLRKLIKRRSRSIENVTKNNWELNILPKSLSHIKDASSTSSSTTWENTCV